MVIQHRAQLYLASPFHPLFPLFSHVFFLLDPPQTFPLASFGLCPKRCVVSLVHSQNAAPIASLNVSYTLGNNDL